MWHFVLLQHDTCCHLPQKYCCLFHRGNTDKTLAAPVPGLELVDEDTWLEGLQDACGFRFKGLDEAALSSLLCFNCAGRPKPLPLWVNPKVVELYAYINV